MGFYCTKCEYKSEKEKIPTRCPYCGTLGTIHKSESADDLISDSVEEMDEIDNTKKQHGYR